MMLMLWSRYAQDQLSRFARAILAARAVRVGAACGGRRFRQCIFLGPHSALVACAGRVGLSMGLARRGITGDLMAHFRRDHYSWRLALPSCCRRAGNRNARSDVSWKVAVDCAKQ